MPSAFETEVDINGCQALVGDLGSRVAVIVTHPWGPLGGNLRNNVVLATVLFFQKSRITTLRFDFSGTQIGWGHIQVQQVCNAANYLLTALPNPPKYILLVGYSYGSLISSSASASIPSCIGSISIAPPWSVQHWLLMFNSNYHLQQSRERQDIPRLYIIGDHDNFTTEQVFYEIVKTFPKSTGAVLKDANHFFGQRERDLMIIISQWLLQTFPQAGGSLAAFGQCDNLQLSMSGIVLESPESTTGTATPTHGSAGYDCGKFLPGACVL